MKKIISFIMVISIFRSRNHYNRTRVNTIDKFAITRIISQYESFGTNTSSRI